MPALTPLQINNLEDSASGRALGAVGAAAGVLDDFTEFTASLVQDIFKVVIDSTLEQLEAYSELVASVSGSLADYEARTLGNDTSQRQKALDFANQVVIPQFTTRAALTLSDIATNSGVNVEFTVSTVSDLRALFADINALVNVNELPAESASKVDDPNYVQPTSPPSEAEVVFDSVLEVDNAANPTVWRMRASHLHLFSLAKLKKEVKASYDKLVVVLKLGMQKVVVSDGEIATSLTFHTEGSDTDELSSTTESRSVDVKSRSFTGSLAFGGRRSSRGRLAGRILSRSLGGSISAGLSASRVRSRLRVNVVNEKKSAVTNLSVDITGSVKIRFKTESFPAYDASNNTAG